MVLLANISALLAGLFLLNYYFMVSQHKTLFEVVMKPNNANEQRNLAHAFSNEKDLYENYFSKRT